MRGRYVEVLAIGAGPSNLGLAVALEELAPDLAARTLIIERHPTIEWQSGLLLPWAKSQVSFLKDLVTLRNPRSRYSFLNFLKATGRLDAFINLGDVAPYRLEISAYLAWVAESLAHVRIELGRTCARIEPVRNPDATVSGWITTLADGSTITSRYLVIGIGRTAHVPEVLADLPPDRIIHSTRYRSAVAALDRELPYRIAVVGASQSAAEMVRALRNDLPDSEVTWLMRSVGPTADPSSRFTNELYYPSYVDEFFDTPAEGRSRIRQELHRTNYSCITPDTLHGLYTDFYRDHLDHRRDRRLVTMTEITGARRGDGEIVLELTDRRNDRVTALHRDLLFLGTGFSWQPPRLIGGLLDAVGLDRVAVTRGYRLITGGPAGGACYLQGVNEETHGIGDSLLSVLARRAQDITLDILAHRDGARDLVPAGSGSPSTPSTPASGPSSAPTTTRK